MMNPGLQRKLAEIKRKTATGKVAGMQIVVRKDTRPDGFSMAIHSQKDANQFINDLAAIRRRRRAK